MNGEDVENLDSLKIEDGHQDEQTNGAPTENSEDASVEEQAPEAEPEPAEQVEEVEQEADPEPQPEEPQSEPQQTTEPEEEEEDESTDQPITLYIKAGVENKIADCPLCQRLFMIITLKNIRYQVCTVNKEILPAEYKKMLGNTPPPVLIDPNVQTENPQGKVIDDIIKAEHYLEMVFQPKLENGNPRAKQVGSNIFSKFSALMKNQDKTRRVTLINRLRSELKKLDEFLKDTSEDDELSPGLFLEGDKLTLADCDLLPKLHRVDVACRLFKFPEVMEGMDAVQKYLENWRSSTIYNLIKYEDKEVWHTYHRVVMKS
ncbi:chloride intracellular channel protein 2-like [Diadema setosum]|uniref:chloride intracellular channel protein 2-like n=1 Tax=Diadema setosum TaxID=31175 RepID=UPI003B3AECA1